MAWCVFDVVVGRGRARVGAQGRGARTRAATAASPGACALAPDAQDTTRRGTARAPGKLAGLTLVVSLPSLPSVGAVPLLPEEPTNSTSLRLPASLCGVWRAWCARSDGVRVR
jgi:hypothetical protein